MIRPKRDSLNFRRKRGLARCRPAAVDLVASASPWTQSRDAGQKVIYPGAFLYDGQGFIVRRQRGFNSAQDLNGVSICVEQGTPYELEVADFFRARKAKYEPKLFASLEDAARAYDDGKCDALTADVSTLHGVRIGLTAPADHAVLPDLLSKTPRGPLVRQGDDQWFNIVRWTLFAMIDAEELDVSKANADAALSSENPQIRRLLGVDGAHGGDLGLSEDWAYRIVKHVGNYADVFERNLGQGAPFAHGAETERFVEQGRADVCAAGQIDGAFAAIAFIFRPPFGERLALGRYVFRQRPGEGAPFLAVVGRHRCDHRDARRHRRPEGVAEPAAPRLLFGEFADHDELRAATGGALDRGAGKRQFARIQIAGDRTRAKILRDRIKVAGGDVAQHDP